MQEKKQQAGASFCPIVRNVKTDVLYQYLGASTTEGFGRYKNLHTGVEGEVPDNSARQTFSINVQASLLVSEYPEAIKLIEKLKLRVDICSNQ